VIIDRSAQVRPGLLRRVLLAAMEGALHVAEHPWRYSPRWQARRLRGWWTAPFRTRVDFYEHTRIEHRVFPYKLRVSVVESAQERIDRGGLVRFPAGTFHLTSPLMVTRPHTTIQDAHLAVHGAHAIEVPHASGEEVDRG